MLVDSNDATEGGGTGKASTDSDAVATTGVMRWTGVVGRGVVKPCATRLVMVAASSGPALVVVCSVGR